MQERFRIIFRCKILPDQELGQVKQNLQKLAGLPAAKIDELFSRAETVLKADADKATADRYKAAINSAGAECDIEPICSSSAPPTPATPVTPSVPQRETTCPKCGKTQTAGDSCAFCGIIYSKYDPAHDRLPSAPLPASVKEPGKSPLAIVGMILALVAIGITAWWLNLPQSDTLPADAIVNQKNHFAYRAPADWMAVNPENFDKIMGQVGGMLPANIRSLLSSRHPGFMGSHLQKPQNETDFATNFNIVVVDTKGKNLPRLTEKEKDNATRAITGELARQIKNYKMVDSKIVEVDGLDSLQITGDAEVTFTTSPAEPIYETTRYGRYFKGYTQAVQQTHKLRMIQTMIPGKKRAYVLTYTGDAANISELERLNKDLVDSFRVTERPPRFNPIVTGAINGALVGAVLYLIFMIITAFGGKAKD